jgi:hypothetical protein
VNGVAIQRLVDLASVDRIHNLNQPLCGIADTLVALGGGLLGIPQRISFWCWRAPGTADKTVNRPPVR